MEERKTEDELREEIRRLKQINLVDYLINTSGFVLNEAKTRKENANKSNPKYVFLEKEKDEYSGGYTRLLVSRISDSDGEQIYLYKNLDNDRDKGNIFSFIKTRFPDRYSIPNAKKRIKNYLHNIEKGYYKEKFAGIQASSGEGMPTAYNMDEIAKKYGALPYLNDFTYLESRGIKKEIAIKSFIYTRMRNEVIEFSNESKDKGREIRVNTVFPLYTIEGEISGYVRKNVNFKQTAGNSLQSIGVWSSDFNRNGVLTHAIITENPIDAISYYQINLANEKDINPVLLASNGTLTENQLKIYEKVIEQFKPQQIILANDNDAHGQYTNAKILAQICPPDYLRDEEYTRKNPLLVDSDIVVTKPNKFTGEITWKFYHEDWKDRFNEEEFLLEHMPAFVRVKEYYEHKNKELEMVNDENKPFKIEQDFHQHRSELKVHFFNSAANWYSITQSIIELKYDFASEITVHQAVNKDWNDDLQEKLGLKSRTELGQEHEITDTEESGGNAPEQKKNRVSNTYISGLSI